MTETARADLAPEVEANRGGRAYARIVSELSDVGLSGSELSRAVGVGVRQIRNWSSGAHTPTGRGRERLLEVEYLARQLREVYTPEGVEIWLFGRKRSLGGQRPIDLLAEERYEEILDAVDQLQSGAM